MPNPNVLIVMIDCLRADFVYQRGLAETPVLRRLLAEGLSFRNAFTPFPMTTPSVASLLTGEFPYRHGAWTLSDHALNPACRTLPECLKDAGYFAAAEMSGPLAPWTGLQRGFDAYHHRLKDMTIHSSWGERFLDDGLRALPEPWFMFLHVWSLHEPRIILPECRDKRFGATEYGRALASIDVYLGRLIERLPSETLLVVTGDHGEEISSGPADKLYRRVRSTAYRYMKKWGLTRRHLYHVYRRSFEGHNSVALFDHLIRVPLIFHAPGLVRQGQADVQVRHFDSMPTILDLVGAAIPQGLAGKSLGGIMQGTQEPHRDVFLGDAGAPGVIKKSRLAGIRVDNRFKYVYSPRGRKFTPHLYDLASDPSETRNVAGGHPDVCAALRARIDALGQGYLAKHEMDEAEKAKVAEHLRSLGYMD